MSSTSGASATWVSTFCAMLGHEYFAEVTDDFIGDDFNLTGLQAQVPRYKDALEMILDVEPDSDWDQDLNSELDDSDLDGERVDRLKEAMAGEEPYDGDAWYKLQELRRNKFMNALEAHAELLYGLIHQRYITSRQGMQQMAEKYDAQHFGCCPRVLCNQARVIPVGCTDTPGEDSVKLFCPSCQDVYTPPNSRFQFIDGAFFGTTFGYLFFMSFPEVRLRASDDPLDLQTTYPGYSKADNAEDDRQPSRRQKKSSSSNTGSVRNASNQLPTSDVLTSMNGIPVVNLFSGLGPGRVYEPRIYGFRVSERAKTGPRMKWLRMRPTNLEELNEPGPSHAVRPQKELINDTSAAQDPDACAEAAPAQDVASRLADDNEPDVKVENEGCEIKDEPMMIDAQQPHGTGPSSPPSVPPEQRKKAQMRSRRTLSARSATASDTKR